MAIEKDYLRTYEQGYIDLLARLIESGHVLQRKQSIEELKNNIVAQAKLVFDANAVWVLLHNFKEDVLRMYFYWGPESKTFEGTLIKPGEGVSGQVFLTCRPEILAGDGMPVLAAFPLLADGRKIGVLGIMSENLAKSRFSEPEIEFAGMVFANQVAVAVDIERQFTRQEAVEAELRNSLRSLVVLHEIGIDLVKDLDLSTIIRKIARYAAEILNADAAAINLGNADSTGVEVAYFYNMPRETEELLLSKHAICSTVFESPRRLVVNDYPNSSWATKEFIKVGVSCIALVPVISRGRVLATISAISFRSDRVFTDEDLDELEFVANQMSVAIENAQLYREQVETRKKIEAYASQLRILNDLSHDINKKTRPQDMADRLAEGVRVLLDCSAAAVILLKRCKENEQTLSYSMDETNPCMLEGTGGIDFEVHDGLYSEMYRTRKPMRISDPSGHPHSRGISENHPFVRGLLGAPLLDTAGNFIGQVMVTDKNDGSDFTETDEELLVALCGQAAIVIEKAEAYQREHHIAEALQQAILAVPRHLRGVEIGLIYESAAEVAKVGGDFYDLFELDDGKIGVVIGDVSGKGLEAATITTMVKSTIRAFAYKGLPPAEVLSESNKAICKQLDINQFITMVYAVLDLKADRLVLCRAGHPEMIIWRDNAYGYCEADSNLPLGVFGGVAYEENEISLANGEGIILYTDGLIEARHGHMLLGEDGLIEELNRVAHGKSPQQIASELIEIAKTFTRGKPQDDMAVIVLRVKE